MGYVDPPNGVGRVEALPEAPLFDLAGKDPAKKECWIALGDLATRKAN